MAYLSKAFDQVRVELDALNVQWPDSEKCYHVELDPPHVLFNLNCPKELEKRVREILFRYNANNESH